MARYIIATLLYLLVGGCDGPGPPADADTQTVVLHGQRFDLELAVDQAARFQGLSDRTSIPINGGMLFVFAQQQPYLQFVMRQCLVPIDVIYLDAGGRIVSMSRMQVEAYDTPEHELRRYSSVYPAQFAIELAGGTLDTLDLRQGQRIELPLADLKRRAR